MVDEQGLRDAVEKDQGAPEFVDLAKLLRERDELKEAVHICLAGLSQNPTFHRGRLLLSRLYFDLHYYPFALRELLQIREAYPDNASLGRLIDKLSPDVSGSEAASSKPSTAEIEVDEETLAEADFDFDSLDELEGED